MMIAMCHMAFQINFRKGFVWIKFIFSLFTIAKQVSAGAKYASHYMTQWWAVQFMGH